MTNQSALQETFDNVAESMTMWMRKLGFASQPIIGTTSLWVLHIPVRWSFLAFPIATMLAGCVFCLIIILETHRLRLRPWRSSCMEVLIHGIGDDLRAQLQLADDPSDAGRGTQFRMDSVDGTMMLLESRGGRGDCSPGSRLQASCCEF